MSEPTIFVSIACYMDSDVINTVHDLFQKARHPDRVYVGICLQYDPDNASFAELEKYRNVRLDTMHYTEAKGPIYARYRCERLLKNEDFYLQIDCHSRFFEGWDEILLEEYKAQGGENSTTVISHYPINVQNMNNEERLKLISKINLFRYIGEDDIKMHGSLVPRPAPAVPGYGISAAMLFMSTQTKQKVPFDPNLHFGLHAAEQFLYSARLWTHGYDFVPPSRHILATEYLSNRDRIPPYARKYHSPVAAEWKNKTWSKVKYYLQLDSFDQVDDAYKTDVLENEVSLGLGKTRSIKDYYQFIQLHSELLKLFPYYRQHYN